MKFSELKKGQIIQDFYTGKWHVGKVIGIFKTKVYIQFIGVDKEQVYNEDRVQFLKKLAYTKK